MPRWQHPCWGVLGIAPTSDQRAIRSAYSTRLKAIDPDTEPQAFMALRDAFDTARVQAQWVDLPEDDDADGREWNGDWDHNWPAEASPFSATPDTPAGEFVHGADPRRDPRASPWTPISAADADSHARALAALLGSDNALAENYPSAEERSAMLAHWAALAADPRMQDVSFFDNADRWFADLIVRVTPFSDPLIIPATRFFGWMNGDGTLSQSWAVSRITRRFQSIRFMEEVQKPDHPLSAAWRELTTPAEEGARLGWINRGQVFRLISLIRKRYPDVEGALDHYRVGMWEGTVERVRQPLARIAITWGTVIGVIGLFIVAVILAPPPPPRVGVSFPPLESAEADLDRALSEVLGGRLTVREIAQANPKLHAELTAYWQAEKQQGVTRFDFINDVRVMLRRWYIEGVRRGDAGLLTDYHRLTLDMVQAYNADPLACLRFLEGHRLWQEAVGMSPALRAREQELMVRTLRVADGKPIPANKEFLVPGEIIAAAAKRAGQPVDQMRRTLRLEGDDAQQCAGRIAFMETVLDLPNAKRVALMRVM
jgi:hypothetical protein